MPTYLLAILLVLIGLIAIMVWATRSGTGFPTDDEGLDDLRQRGVDLTKPCRFDFHLHFANREVAVAAAEAIAAAGYKAQVSAGENLLHSIVSVEKSLMPTKEELLAARTDLSQLARRFKGKYQGWFCDNP